MKWVSLIGVLIAATVSQAVAAPLLAPCASASYIRPEAPKEAAVGVDPTWLVRAPTNKSGCELGLRIPAGAALTIWRCQVAVTEGIDPAEGQSGYAFLIQRPNAPLIELTDELMAAAFHNFELIKVDLDGDGLKEHVLAAWNAQGNGLGVNTWTIHVFDSQWVLLKRFTEVADWGDSSLAAAPIDRSGCDLIITSYEDSSDQGQRSYSVLRAQFYSVLGTQTGPMVVLAGDRPVLERRLTNRFMKQRTAWFDANQSKSAWQWRGDVASWLKHPSTKITAARPSQ